MSEPASAYGEFGFDRDPFETTIADEEIAAQYDIVGRDEQEYLLQQFVEEAIRDPDRMKRRLIFGDYGTGKSHHLIKLRNSIRDGVEVDGTEHQAIAVYLGNLGLSIRRLYEKIVEEVKQSAPELEGYIDGLSSVEPDDSVEESYEFEKLRDNIVENIRKIVQAVRQDHGYRCMYIFIDEAEDIANADEETVQPFVRAFLHLVNELSGSGIHILLGFSQGARMRITSYNEDDDSLGNALTQRFQGGEIYLGDLTEDDVKEMLIDRMDHHRTSNRGSVDPVADETVSVVSKLTGGHPREILRIYSQALEYAAKVDADRVDGEAIVYALTGFKSFVREDEILSQEAITTLKKALDDTHPNARGDFERLQGRLIGESEAVPEKAFSEGVPQALLAPITIEGGGGDTEELRVLEQREQHGRYSYVLSEAAREYLFGDAGGGGTKIQKLDLRASNAPDKHQGMLSRGVGLALQAAGKGNLHKDPVTKAVDRYEYRLYLIDIRRGDAKRDQTVAVGVYNGQEIPAELVDLYVNALNEDGASFGVFIKQSQQRSAGANKYLNELEQTQREAYNDRIIDIDLTTDQRDMFIYGRLLGLGDPEVDADQQINEGRLASELGIMSELEELFESEILPYPDSIYRKVIDRLEAEDERNFTIGDLREELDLADYELNSDIMRGLQSQALVAKSGHRWTYPDVENDRPPWHEIYREINEVGPLTIEELQQRLASKFAFDCPQGDENAMLQWYLDHLQRQNYVEPTTVTRDGATIEAFDIVSVNDQFTEELGRANDRLDVAGTLYERADELGVSEANSYQNRLEDLRKRHEEYNDIFNPEHNDLNGVRTLIDDIVDLEEDIESAVESQEEKILGNAKGLRDHRIDSLQREISETDAGSFSQRLEDLSTQLGDLREELENLIDNQQFARLQKRMGGIEAEVNEIKKEFEEVTGLKQKCTDLYSDIQTEHERVEELVERISQRNNKRSELESELSDLSGYLEEYQSAFNDGKFEEALGILKDDADPLANDLIERASTIVTDQTSYNEQLDTLEKQAKQTDDSDRRVEALKLIENAREETKEGNFAEVPRLVDQIKNLLKGPTRREQFLSAIQEADGDLGSLLNNSGFSKNEAFSFLERTYGEEVTEVQVLLEESGN